MKKLIAFVLAALLTVFAVSCSKNGHADPNIGKKPIKVDLSSVLEVDDGQMEIEADLNHVNVVSGLGQTFYADSEPEDKTVMLADVAYDLTYSRSVYYPWKSMTLHVYNVNGDEKKPVLLDEEGDIKAVLFPFFELKINESDSSQRVLEVLKAEWPGLFDISFYKHVDYNERTPDACAWRYHYTFYNECDGYITDYLMVTVTQKGEISYVSENNLPVSDLEVDIDKEKEREIMEAKMKDIYTTDDTQYQSYETAFTPYIRLYEGQLYVEYQVGVKYLWLGETTSSFLNTVLIPLHMLNR